jgi:YVTN family beta-propeller protein
MVRAVRIEFSDYVTIPLEREPSGIAITKPGSFINGEYVYVANRDDGTVSVIDGVTDTIVLVIDGVTNSVVPAIPVGKGPKGVAAGIIPTAP